MDDMDYKKYSFEHLGEWVNDAINLDDASAKEIYDVIIGTVQESMDYHGREYSKARNLMSMLTSSTKDKEREYNLREAEYYNKRAQLDAEYNMKSEASQKEWNDFWENSATLNSSDC